MKVALPNSPKSMAHYYTFENMLEPCHDYNFYEIASNEFSFAQCFFLMSWI